MHICIVSRNIATWLMLTPFFFSLIECIMVCNGPTLAHTDIRAYLGMSVAETEQALLRCIILSWSLYLGPRVEWTGFGSPVLAHWEAHMSSSLALTVVGIAGIAQLLNLNRTWMCWTAWISIHQGQESHEPAGLDAQIWILVRTEHPLLGMFLIQKEHQIVCLERDRAYALE